MRRCHASGEMDQATAVYDASDQLAFTIFKEQRIDVPLAQISPNLVKALLAIEDQRFYEHRGFDLSPHRVGGVGQPAHRAGLRKGGSTITQQLARQSFLTPDKTIRRKLQELILAARIERRYPKEQILELYLNKVYFGDGLYGVEAASRGYFGKHASELTVAGGGAACRPREVAVELCADRQHGTRDRAAERRAAGDARERRDRLDADWQKAARRRRSCCTMASGATSRTASTSRSRSGASSSTGSAGSASIRAGCASTRPSTCRCRSRRRRRSPNR